MTSVKTPPLIHSVDPTLQIIIGGRPCVEQNVELLKDDIVNN
jgi:hypothetical protein